MPCVTDHNHFLASSGLAIATLAYLSPCVAAKAWWIKWLMAALMAQMTFAVLAAYSDAWNADALTAVGTMGGLFLVFLFAAYQAAAVMLLGSVLLLLGPFVSHQIMLLTVWLRDNVSDALPQWFGVALFATIIIGVGAVVWLLRLVERTRIAVYVVVGSVVEFVFLRLAWIEAEAQTDVACCDWSNGDPIAVFDVPLNATVLWVPPRDNTRCPLDLATWANAFLLVALMLFALAQAAWWQTRPVASARPARQRYAKVHESPQPIDDETVATDEAKDQVVF
ncbi:MAG: hypothetical protein Q7V62_07850 [Actinomycetota bacterium]|nr:hypothetical protein [Actinomycetota bacterium]